MTPADLVAEAARRGVVLALGPGGRLRYDGPAEVLDDDFLDLLAEHKAGVVEYLILREDLARLVPTRAEGGGLAWVDPAYRVWDFVGVTAAELTDALAFAEATSSTSRRGAA